MCFYIHPKHQEVKIAKKDIVCYKALLKKYYGDIVSPHREMLYFTKANSHPAIKRVNNFGITRRYIYQGLHSYSNFREARFSNSCYSIHKAIIPKGTEYYYNPEHKEYVSLKLKVWKKDINKIKK